MMRFRSIGFRLTLWYFAVLSVALVAFGVAMWFAMRQSLFGAVDGTLREQARGVGRFIQDQGASAHPEEMREEFREHSVLGPGGDLFQVCDSNGNWLYRSGVLREAPIPVYTTDQLKSTRRYDNVRIHAAPFRLLSRNVEVLGQLYAVQVAAPVHELQEGLEQFFWILVCGIPVVLVFASLGGYWLSRRALVPVDEITQAAQSISAQSLSRRLPVPGTGDELERLSSTLNAMFERLDAAFGRITRFTADASHELRTPIAFLRTTAELALRRQRSETEYREALTQILSELERTSGLVEDLMVLARADSGSGGMRFEPMDVIVSIREACEQGRVLAESKQIEFEASMPEAAVEIEGDCRAVRRVFLILIDNAVKYTAAGGRIAVNFVQKTGSACIEVRDSGIGIAAEDLPHIFDRFYRADKARSREMGGVGLGLAIAQWIVEVHQGKIEVESVPGQGSTFRIALPMYQTNGVEQESKSAAGRF